MCLAALEDTKWGRCGKCVLSTGPLQLNDYSSLREGHLKKYCEAMNGIMGNSDMIHACYLTKLFRQKGNHCTMSVCYVGIW